MRTAFLLAAILLAGGLNGKLKAKDTPMQEIHLIHHSHTDLGFTDLASTAMALHAGYIGQAVEFADATADYPDECAVPLDVRKRVDGRAFPP